MIISTEKFYKIKHELDGSVFWREVENGIELKFIPKFKEDVINLINEVE
jgi:hypothetical protein